MLTDRYHSDVVEGLEPSIQYARDLLSLSSFAAYSILKLASIKDLDRKRYQLLISQNIHVENEAKRLMISGRSPDDLEPIYRSIDESVSREMEAFRKKVAEDLSALESELDEQLQAKLSVQREFENTVSDMYLQLQDDLAELNAEDPEAYLRIKYTRELKFQNDCCEACKIAVNKASGLNSVFDELHIQRQFEQQKFEAMQYIIERALQADFKGLMRSQQSRRDLGAALINEYERDLKGLENVLAEKKHRQQMFLRDRLAKRKEFRRKELSQDGAIPEEEVLRIIEEEYQHDLSVGEAEIAKGVEEDVLEQARELESNYQAGLSELTSIASIIGNNPFADTFESVMGQVVSELASSFDPSRAEEFSSTEPGLPSEEQLERSKAAYLEQKRKMLEELGRSTDEHLRLELESDAHRLELAHVAALEALGSELATKRTQSKDALQARLLALRSKKKSELMGAGVPEEEAEAAVEAEYKAAMDEGLAQLEHEEMQAKEALHAKYAKLMGDLNRQYQKSFDILQNGVDKHLASSNAAIESSLAMEKRRYVTTLIEDGMDMDEAEAQAERKFISDLEMQRKENEALARIAAEKVRDLVTENIEAKARMIRAEHDRKIHGLAVAQEKEREDAVSSLRHRLEKRKARRVEALSSLGADAVEAARIADNEYSEIDKQLADFEEQLVDRHMGEFKTRADALNRYVPNLFWKFNRVLCSFCRYRDQYEADREHLQMKEDSEASKFFQQVIETERELASKYEETASASCDVLLQVSQEVKDLADGELREWREKYEADCKRLEEELLASKAKEKQILKSQLEARRRNRAAELRNKGLSTVEAESQAEEEIHTEEVQLMREFDEKAAEESEELARRLRADGEREEQELLQRKHQLAAQAAKDAELERIAAQQRLDELRQQQLLESRKLEESIDSNRRANETKLKARLAAKREAALKDLANKKATDEERLRTMQRLEEEEHQSLIQLQRQREEEEAQARLEHQKRQELLLAEVEREAKEKELAALAEAAREKALLALRDVQARSEEETNSRNLQRLRELHAKEEEKLREADRAQKAQGKGKLAERLAQKRAQREKELADKEARALEELAAKQAAERKARGEEQAAKVVWTEKLREIMEEANRLELLGAEFEDYCLQNIVAAKVVPPKQFVEAIERIVGPRFSSDMAVLLKRNFNERMQELKEAVQKVLDDKAITRLRLLESLSEQGADDEVIRSSIRSLDEEYSAKQQAVEAEVANRLDPQHMQQQVDLRQQQLQHIASLVSLYSDPEALVKLQDSAKSQAEELEEYRRRIEHEKRVREERLVEERKELEEKLRRQHEEEVRRMQEQLQRDMEQTEAAFEAEKRALLERKEQMEKQQLEEKGTLDNKEKDRILQEFERENNAALEALEKEKSNQKKKLQERLQAKRQLKAAKTPVQTPEDSKSTKKLNQISQLWTKITERRVSITAQKESEAKKPPDSGKTTQRRTSISSIGQNLKDAVAAVASSATASLAPSATINPQVAAAIAQIEAKLERIETVINAIASSSTPPSTKLTISEISGSYRDDNEPRAGEGLVPVEDEETELLAQELARLTFGRRLANMVGLKDIRVRAAVSLPPPTVTNNAFAYSYIYDTASNTLYVHKDRLSSSGDFGLLAMHAFSHVKVSIQSIVVYVSYQHRLITTTCLTTMTPCSSPSSTKT